MLRRPRPAVALVVLSLLVWAASASEDDLDTLRRDVAALSAPEMEGRGAGTAGLDRARDLIADRFKKLGLRPAFDGSYTQPFDVPLGVRVAEQSLRLHPVEAEVDADADADAEAGRDFTVLGFSGLGAFAGEAVFVGYAIDEPARRYDSFAGLGEDALTGKVAIAFRFEPVDARGDSRWATESTWTAAAHLTRKADAAARRGAVALLVVNPPSVDGPLRTTAQTAFGEQAAIPVLHVDSLWLARALRAASVQGQRIDDPAAFLREMQARADRGRDRPVRLQGIRLAGRVALERPTATLHNVAAVLPGHGTLADQWVVLGAHYDHLGRGEIGSLHSGDKPLIHPGADDNASGVAGLLLLAGQLQRPLSAGDDLNLPENRRCVLFIAFSGEERGLLGSTHFIRTMADHGLAPQDIALMINFDMIGRLRDRRLYVFGVDTAEGMSPVVRAAVRDAGLQLVASGSGVGASDHTAFIFARVPAVHLFTGVHEDYHRPTDTADRINHAGIAQAVDVAARLARHAMTQPDRPRFVDVEDPHEIHAPGIQRSGLDRVGHAMGQRGAYLGVMPDYATLEGETGAGLAAVTPRSPADAAGLQPGDRITAWNDQPVRNVRDLTARLAAASPGDAVTLTIDRAGQARRITATLGRR